MSQDDVGDHPIFANWYGKQQAWGPDGRWTASFGGNVLETVITGLAAYRMSERWSSRTWPALVGCVPWLSDKKLIEEILCFGSSTVVINKPTGSRPLPTKQALRLHQDGPGFPVAAFEEFYDLAPKVDGSPAVIGPSSNPSAGTLDSLRLAGIRGRSGRWVTRYVHAKMLVIGEVWWHDEGALGEVGDFYGFKPKHVWLGSANFTSNSRKSIEFGIWSDEKDLVSQTYRFLMKLLRYSEPVDSEYLGPEPEYAPFEYDDEAMAAAAYALAGLEEDSDSFDLYGDEVM